MRQPVVITAGLVLLSVLAVSSLPACNSGCPEGYTLRGSVCHFEGAVKMDAGVEGTAKPGLMGTAGGPSAGGVGAGAMSAAGGGGGASGVGERTPVDGLMVGGASAVSGQPADPGASMGGTSGVMAGNGADAAAGRAGAAGSMDINQCVTNNGGCDTSPMATCSNNVGAAPGCACPSGYTGSGVGVNGCAVTDRFLSTTDTVFDSTTKLTWQRAVPTTYAPVCSGSYEGKGTVGDSCTSDDAGKYCTSLALGGSGWRLPTKDELLSIVDMTRTNPAIDPVAFPGTPSDWFWTSSSGDGWIVDLYGGNTSRSATTNALRVRCVR